jgi:hypothetical protein
MPIPQDSAECRRAVRKNRQPAAGVVFVLVPSTSGGLRGNQRASQRACMRETASFGIFRNPSLWALIRRQADCLIIFIED